MWVGEEVVELGFYLGHYGGELGSCGGGAGDGGVGDADCDECEA